MIFPYFRRFRLDGRSSPPASLQRTSAGRVLPYLLRLLFMSAAILTVGSSNAYAYIDPGYGSLLWQLLIAGFFGSLFYARSIIFKIKHWLNATRKDKPKGD